MRRSLPRRCARRRPRLPEPNGQIGGDSPGSMHWIIGSRALKSNDRYQGRSVEYRVELDVYNGPLDLLLYLIKRDELDIYDIPIARITDSYMEYVTSLRQLSDKGALDINVAGEFLVMAATLMEIKSAMLLPKAPVADAAGGPTAAQE